MNLLTHNLRLGRTGQTFLEMMVALSILMIGFLGIVALVNSSLGVNRSIADNYRATYLAAEGVEIVKSILDTNLYIRQVGWACGLPDGDYTLDYRAEVPQTVDQSFCESGAPYPFLNQAGNEPLLFNAETHTYSYDLSGEPVETPFRRTVQVRLIPYPSGSGRFDKMEVQSMVQWTDRGQENEVILEDHFYNSEPQVAESEE